MSALSHWFFHGVNAQDRARPAASSNAMPAEQAAEPCKQCASHAGPGSSGATRLLQWTHGLLPRRFVAMRRTEAPD